MNCKQCGIPLVWRRPIPPGFALHAGRGLCNRDWHGNNQNGTLDKFPRNTRRSVDVYEDYEWLLNQGYPRSAIAHRLGMTMDALEQAVTRVRRAQKVNA